MIIFKEASALHQYISRQKQQNKIVGFVPTMGALHQGHMSLIEASKKKCDITVCSIFVNPTQFNDPKDFEKYPVTLDKDILMLTQHDTNVLFLPSVTEMYPDGINDLPHYDLGEIEFVLEGKYRPGHFQGVCQVVDRLFSIVQPHEVFFGRKDYQQCMVIQKLITMKHPAIEMNIEPTMRETDGLAMSSRNMRLSEKGRKKATALYQTLLSIKEQLNNKELASLKAEANQKLLAAGFEKIDYISIADANTLQEIEFFDKETNAVALAAAFLEGVRLIDNVSLSA